MTERSLGVKWGNYPMSTGEAVLNAAPELTALGCAFAMLFTPEIGMTRD